MQQNWHLSRYDSELQNVIQRGQRKDHAKKQEMAPLLWLPALLRPEALASLSRCPRTEGQSTCLPFRWPQHSTWPPKHRSEQPLSAESRTSLSTGGCTPTPPTHRAPQIQKLIANQHHLTPISHRALLSLIFLLLWVLISALSLQGNPERLIFFLNLLDHLWSPSWVTHSKPPRALRTSYPRPESQGSASQEKQGWSLQVNTAYGISKCPLTERAEDTSKASVWTLGGADRGWRGWNTSQQRQRAGGDQRPERQGRKRWQWIPLCSYQAGVSI